MKTIAFLVLGCVALLPGMVGAQEQSGQSVKDKLRSTLPP